MNLNKPALHMLSLAIVDVIVDFYDAFNVSTHYIESDDDEYEISFTLDKHSNEQDKRGLDTFFDDIKAIEEHSHSGTLTVSPMNYALKTSDLYDYLQLLERISESFDLKFDTRLAEVKDLVDGPELDENVVKRAKKILSKNDSALLSVQQECYVSFKDAALDIIAHELYENDYRDTPRPRYSFDELRRAIETEKKERGESGFKGQSFHIH